MIQFKLKPFKKLINIINYRIGCSTTVESAGNMIS